MRSNDLNTFNNRMPSAPKDNKMILNAKPAYQPQYQPLGNSNPGVNAIHGVVGTQYNMYNKPDSKIVPGVQNGFPKQNNTFAAKPDELASRNEIFGKSETDPKNVERKPLTNYQAPMPKGKSVSSMKNTNNYAPRGTRGNSSKPRTPSNDENDGLRFSKDGPPTSKRMSNQSDKFKNGSGTHNKYRPLYQSSTAHNNNFKDNSSSNQRSSSLKTK